MKFHIEQIWIDEDAQGYLLTAAIVRQLQEAKVFVGSEISAAKRALDMEPDPMTRGKRILRLMKHKGAFVKPCPGTPQYICCGLEILHIGQGCPMECRYCALQVYFNRPVLEVFVNTDDMLTALRDHLESGPQRFHRICTGEFTDSLALEPLTGLAQVLVNSFSECKNACLEIKTKTDSIEPLLAADPKGRVVLSFSVNSNEVTRSEEKRAAPLEMRLASAARAQECGYRIGFHFDPIIPLPGWEEGYPRTIEKIFGLVRPSAIAWMSMGVLRFVPELKEIAGARFGRMPYFHDGFLRGLDGKSRLHSDRRIRIYRHLAESIRKHCPDLRIYLCMESPHVWQESLGLRMETDQDLAAYLDAAVS
ncbi:MAG: spore photoproduct lyase family protein [Desulfomonilaceae bacterium]